MDHTTDEEPASSLAELATAVLFECLLHGTGGKGGRRLRNPSATVPRCPSVRGQSDAARLRLSLRRAWRAAGGSELIFRPEPLRGDACPAFSRSSGVDLLDSPLPPRRRQ